MVSSTCMLAGGFELPGYQTDASKLALSEVCAHLVYIDPFQKASCPSALPY